jgi:multidrug efflux system outer membrane protein
MNTGWRLFQLCMTILLMGGCTMVPRYQRPIAPVASSFADGPAAVTRPAAAADLGWRDVFSDQRLQRLIELALVNNLDLRVAILNVEQSRAQYRITRSALFPHVEGDGSYIRSQSLGVTGDSWNASLGSTAYELDLFGRVRSLNEQALEEFFATAEARRSAQISLVAELANEYFTLRADEEQLKVAEQVLATVQESYKLNEASFNAGDASELDVRTAEGQVHTAKINVLEYERQIAQAQHALEPLVGGPLPVDLPIAAAFTDAQLVADVPAGLPSDLVQRRPDILEAEHTLKAANANIGAARAAFFPTISLTGSIGTSSTAFQKLFGSGTGVWSFSPQITVPIFTAGENVATLEAAKVSTRIEVANYQKAIQIAFREVADALVATSNYRKQIDEQATLIVVEQRRFDLANLRYRQGDAGYLDVLSAQQDLYNAQQNQLQAQLNKLSGQISLYKALGGGWK